MMQHILRNLKQSTRNRFLVTMYALQQFTGKETGEYHEFKNCISLGDCSPIDIVSISIFGEDLTIQIVTTNGNVYAPFYLEDLSDSIMQKITDSIIDEIAEYI